MGDRTISRPRRAPLRRVTDRLGRRLTAVRAGRSIEQASHDIRRLIKNEGPGGLARRAAHELAELLSPRQPAAHPAYSQGAAFTSLYDPDEEVLRANRAVVDRFDDRPSEVRSATWFLTAFDHALFGGVYTILRLMDWMKQHHGVEHRLVIFDNPAVTDADIRNAISAAFPGLVDIDIVAPVAGLAPMVPFDELPPTDIAICTIWLSAYALARFNATHAKFYLVQDYEPSFYPAGTLSALAEATYRMGFAGLVNTPGLEPAYAAFGNPSVSFTPAVDRLATECAKPSLQRGAPVQVVLYGRPKTDRNAFELIASACHQLKARYGSAVRIVSAGSVWDPSEFDLEGIVDNLGLLQNLDEVHELYLGSDIGVCLSLSKHPSYQPFEYFAARTAVVANVNPATSWMLRDQENCLISEPFPGAIASAIGRLVEDPELRAKLSDAGFEMVNGVDWNREFEKVWAFVTGTGASPR